MAVQVDLITISSFSLQNNLERSGSCLGTGMSTRYSMLINRVSVLGFLGASKPSISGNYGFKDCWLGLEWVRDNIASFGGESRQYLMKRRA
jgi:hypothetical protein